MVEKPTEFIAIPEYEKWMRRGIPAEGDVILTSEAPLGEVAEIPKGRIALAQRLFTLHPHADVFSKRFLKYLMISEYIQNQLFARASGTTVLGIKQSELRKIVLVLPPLPEQKAIAHILGTIDDQIELLRQMNDKIEAMARALFRSWFVEFEPVRKKAEGRATGLSSDIDEYFPDLFEDSELGEIPKGWGIAKLGDYCSAINEKISPEEMNRSENYVGLEHIPRRSISLSSWGVSADLQSNKSKFIENDILFGKLRPYFHKVVLAPVNGVCSTDVLVIRANVANCLAFSLMWLSSVSVIDYATAFSNGTKMPRSSWADLKSYSIASPPSALLEVYSSCLRPMIETLKGNIKEARHLKSLHDYLLRKLISREIEIGDIGKILEPAK